MSDATIALKDESLATLVKGIKDGSHPLDDPEALRALAKLRAENKLGFNLLINDVLKLKADIKGSLNAALDAICKEDNQVANTVPPDETKRAAAYKILKHGNPIQKRLEYVKRHVQGNEGTARATIYSCSSVYLSSKKVHVDVPGSSQSGKTVTVDTTHDTYPPEDVLRLTEASPMSLYYYAKDCLENGVSLENMIICINDARPDHIPFMKVARDDCKGNPCNLTVVNGESVMLEIPGHPVIQTSSVLPLRDLEGQAISRSFLAPIKDATAEEEAQVKKTIREREEYGELLEDDDTEERETLQEMTRILRDEGVHKVIITFDPSEPEGADRRGTGQFMRLIKVSAHENQFQRPILEMVDGKKYIIATYADLKNAAELWFEFETAQTLKITPKVLKVFDELPIYEPPHSYDHKEEYEYTFNERAPSINWISENTKIGAKSVSRYLSDLVAAGLVFKKQVNAPGSPYVFWTTRELRQKVMSEIPATGNSKKDSGQPWTKNGCPKYLEENCPDSLKTSYYSFFTNIDIIRQENIMGISFPDLGFVSVEEVFSSLSLLEKHVLNTHNETDDSECPRQPDLSKAVIGGGAEATATAT